MLRSASTNQSNSQHPPLRRSPPAGITEEATLDAIATEKLKSNSRPHICVPLQPLAPGLAQFVDETSRECDFMERVSSDEPEMSADELFSRYRWTRTPLLTQQLRDD